MQDTDLAKIATDRSTSLFQTDMDQRADEIRTTVAGARILVIGGAGSIGSATVRELVRFAPAALHVIDQNENELAELVCCLRSASETFPVEDFRTLPLDFGSIGAGAFLRSGPGYDLVLNFAAIKHVRSENDSFSILQMFDTSIAKQARQAVAPNRATGNWPLLLTGLDTSGEKPYEEFVADGEHAKELGYEALLGVPYLALNDPGTMAHLMAELETLFERSATRPVDKNMLKEIIALAEPDFLNRHHDSGRSLDQRV